MNVYKYFDNINTQSKAYWLGYFYADGCICNQYTVSLTSKDKKAVLEFREDLKIKNKIFIDKRKKQYYYTLIIGSKYMVTILFKKYKLVTNKYNKLILPKLQKRLYRHFIRGFFDGDGCVLYGSNRVSFILQSASVTFLLQIQKIIDKFLNNDNKQAKLHKDRNSYRLVYCKKKHIPKLYKYLYINSYRYLNRKKIKFREAIKTYNKRR